MPDTRRRRFVAALALLAVGGGHFACDGYSKRPGLLEVAGIVEREPLDVTLVTFNVRYGTATDGPNAWPNRRNLVVDALRRANADVFALQEALAFQLDELRAAFPTYRAVGVGRDDGARAGEFAPIFYDAERFVLTDSGTFWFSATPGVPGSTSFGNTLPRICTWVRLAEREEPGDAGSPGRPGARAFTVWNVHLDHESEASRVESIKALRRRVLARENAAEPFVIAGDLNAPPESEPLKLLLTPEAPWPGVTDTLTSAPPAPGAKPPGEMGTFHGFAGTAGPRIDFLFTSPGSTTVSAKIDDEPTATPRGPRYPSDHHPVRGRVRLGRVKLGP
jgi:endonuclease/exonuclease/phosphatase family metal-dependent hydrolase